MCGKKQQRAVRCLTALIIISVLAACTEPRHFLYKTDERVWDLVMQNDPRYPDMSFAVLSDLHYFAPELLTAGDAFQAYLDHDRKMLIEGPEILDAALDEIERVQLDFVIICGDLTKDGEATSHQQVAEKLQILQQTGKSVFVVPGNHDVNNGAAYRYNGATVEPVANVTPHEFEHIYRSCGYDTALYKDPHSLSYIVEPIAGLWLFALDSCRYRVNKPHQHPQTDGMFYPASLSWIEEKLIEAIEKKKAVIGFLHHGVLEHYSSNEKHYGDYLLDGFPSVSEMLAAYGMRFIFTGHFHAQDITLSRWPESGIENHFLFDIETGSLVTYPVPWRLVQISKQQMTIQSYRIQSITSHPHDFQNFAEQFVRQGTILLANQALTRYGVPAADQMLLSPQIAAAYIAHIQGDEITPDPLLDLEGLSPIGRMVINLQGSLIEGWYNDLPPSDNQVVIAMDTGEIRYDQARRF